MRFVALVCVYFTLLVCASCLEPTALGDCQGGVAGRAAEAGQLTVIWLMDPFDEKKSVEGDWINRVVLRDTPHRPVVDYSLNLFVDNALVIFSSSNPDTLAPVRTYLEGFRARGLRFSVYHLSDEFYAADPQRTIYDSVSGVAFRNYFFDLYDLNPRVEFLPLGFTNGAFRSSEYVKPPSERGFAWAFIGQISRKPSREAMRNAMLMVGDVKYYTHETQTWGRFDPISMNASQMGVILADSIFCPSPRGWWNKVRLCSIHVLSFAELATRILYPNIKKIWSLIYVQYKIYMTLFSIN
jgi:hypothetical protein